MATDTASFAALGRWRVLDAEARQLTNALRAGRLTLLVGAAKLGKTTLLAAGVLPLLCRRASDLPQRPGASHVVAPFPDRRSRLRLGRAELLFYFDQWGGAPLSSVSRALDELLGDPGVKAGNANPAEAMWPERLSTLSRQHGGARILFVFDHFEQLLEAPRERADTQRLVDAWVRAVNTPGLNAHFLVALDDRAWPQLQELGKRIPGFDAQAFRLQAQSGQQRLAPLRGDSPSHRADAPGGGPPALDFEVSLVAMLSEVAQSARRAAPLSSDFDASLGAMLSKVAESARQAVTSPSAKVTVPDLPGNRVAGHDASGTGHADATARAAETGRSAEEASRDAEAQGKAEAERGAEAELVARAHLAGEAEAAQRAEALRVAEAERLARARSDAESEAAHRAELQRAAEDAAAAEDRRIAQAAEAARKAEAERVAEAELAAQARRTAEAEAARRAEARRVADAAAAAETRRFAEAADAARRADGERAAAAERVARDVPTPIAAAAAGISPTSATAFGSGTAGPFVASTPSARPPHAALRWGGATLAVMVLGALLWSAQWGQPVAPPATAPGVATVPPSPVGASPATATGAPGTSPATALSAPTTMPPLPLGPTETGRFEVQVDAVDGSGDRIAHELARALSSGGAPLRVVPAAEGADPVVGLRAPGRLTIARYDALRAARNNVSAPPLRVLAPLYAEEVAFIVRADSPLKFIHDLRGRRVNIGPDHEGGSLTVQEIYRQMFGVAMTAPPQFGKDAALAELVAFRSIDAMAIVDAQPSAWLASVDPLTARGLRLLKLDPRHAADRRALRAFRTAVVQPGPGVRERTPTLAVMSFLVASGDGDADSKRLTEMARTLCRELPRLRAGGHPKWRELQPSLKLDTGWPVVMSAQSVLTDCAP